MAGAARRLALVGTPLELQGTKLDGTPLDWQAYRGKVVLVQFWTSASRNFPALLAHTRQTYELYRDRGFDVLGINLDLDRGQLGQFVAAEESSLDGVARRIKRGQLDGDPLWDRLHCHDDPGRQGWKSGGHGYRGPGARQASAGIAWSCGGRPSDVYRSAIQGKLETG